MTAYPIPNPFSAFNDLSGLPLTSGFLYIGLPGEDPETDPMAVYRDAALTVPFTQPLRTIGGYIAYTGAPANAYPASTPYSLRLRNKLGVEVFYLPTVHDEIADFLALIAGGAGAGMVGFSQSNTYAQGTVGQRLKNTIYVTDAPFNCTDDDVDCTDGLEMAIAEAAARQCKLVFPRTDGGTGVYSYSRPLDFSLAPDTCGEGDVTLHYTGTESYCAILEGPTGFKYRHRFGNFTFRGKGDLAVTQDGLRVQSHVHGYRYAIRGEGITRDIVSVLGDVDSEYDDCGGSGNEGSFGSIIPRSGVFVSRYLLGADYVPTTDCNFNRPLAERTATYGIFVEYGDCNTFNVGTSESIGADNPDATQGIGLYLSQYSNQNKVYALFCEANRLADVRDYGKRNTIFGATFNSVGPDPTPTSVISVLIGATSEGCVLQDCTIWRLTIEAGAGFPTYVRTRVLNQIIDGNNGVGTFVQGLQNDFATVGYKPSIRIGNVSDPSPLAWDWFEKKVLFTPTVFGTTTPGTPTYTEQFGRYDRDGSRTTCDIRLAWSAFAGAAGNIAIGGLPYAAANTSGISCVANITAPSLTFAGQLVAEVLPGTNTVMLYSMATGAALAGVSIDTSAAVHLTLSYDA